MQRYQTDFCIAQELPSYYRSPQWHAAKHVLDVGTGNGYYLSKIAARFPEKDYVGVDIAGQLIAIARRENTSPSARFECGDLFALEGKFDFIIARLVLQHLEEPHSVLNTIAELTEPGGSVLFVDALDLERFYWPALPTFTDFFGEYVAFQKKLGLDRDTVGRLAEIVAGDPNWNVGEAVQVRIPSTIGGNLELFRRNYSLFIDLVQTGSEMTYDFKAVRDEWHAWSRLENSYTQVGLQIVRLDRN